MFSIFIPLERLKRTVTHCQKMDEWLAVKAGRYPRFFFRGIDDAAMWIASSIYPALIYGRDRGCLAYVGGPLDRLTPPSPPQPPSLSRGSPTPEPDDGSDDCNGMNQDARYRNSARPHGTDAAGRNELPSDDLRR